MGCTLFAASIAMLSIGGCTMVNTPSVPSTTVQSFFYPLDNGLIYTYARFEHNRYDTISLELEIGQPPDMRNKLVNIATGEAVYYIGYSQDIDKNVAGIIATDTSTLMALDGRLEPNATWIADESNGIRATVVSAPYDDYYLPGRKQDYTNVLPIKYHVEGQPDENYTLRFFAEGHGLILEQEFVGSGTQIASLQLISIQYPS